MIRDLERASIRKFVADNRHFLSGRVLDFGAGKPGTCLAPQPYRNLIEAPTGRGIEYVPFDIGDPMPGGSFDAILCTQVMQYLEDPVETIFRFWEALKSGGYLVLTYPTNWPEVESSDLWRFTKAGMERMLRRPGFAVHRHEARVHIISEGLRFELGYGCVASR